MKSRQRGATLLLLMVLLASAVAVAGTTLARRGASRHPVIHEEARELAYAADALRGHAFVQHCLNTSRPYTDLLPCPDTVTEGVAAPSCPGITRGWLPWRTLGLPSVRDRSGTCLWYERAGTTARVIAAGGASAVQNRANAAARIVCRGNYTATNYLDANDAALAITLDTAMLATRCP